MELAKDLEAMLTLNKAQALSVMNYVVSIHNDLLSDQPECGWVKMGELMERLANIVRKDEKTKA